MGSGPSEAPAPFPAERPGGTTRGREYRGGAPPAQGALRFGGCPSAPLRARDMARNMRATAKQRGRDRGTRCKWLRVCPPFQFRRIIIAMCGIVGYIGTGAGGPHPAGGAVAAWSTGGMTPRALAVLDPEQGLQVAKAKGRLQVLADLTRSGAEADRTHGLGHTRWATHGAPNDVNSHPQVSQSGRIAVVHNGIIENYARAEGVSGVQGGSLHLGDRYGGGGPAAGLLLRGRPAGRGGQGAPPHRGGLCPGHRLRRRPGPAGARCGRTAP